MGDNAHLTMLQGPIARMASNAFAAKGWSITITTAVLGFALKDHYQILWAGLPAVLIFWIMDAYYLALERRFRGLFDAARQRCLADQDPTFEMNPGAASLGDIARAALSKSAWLVHGTLIACLVAAYILLRA